MIVAEEITSRFLNVIQLFNGAIPLIALKMTAYQVGEDVALTFVKVLDELTLGLVGDDENVAEATDRSFWETKRGTKKTLGLTDQLLKLAREIEPKANLKYNKYYIGLEVDGSSMNFVKFVPRKAHVLVHVKLPQSQETSTALEEAGLDLLSYDTQWKEYRLRVDADVLETKRDALKKLFGQAKQSFWKTS